MTYVSLVIAERHGRVRSDLMTLNDAADALTFPAAWHNFARCTLWALAGAVGGRTKTRRRRAASVGAAARSTRAWRSHATRLRSSEEEHRATNPEAEVRLLS